MTVVLGDSELVRNHRVIASLTPPKVTTSLRATAKQSSDGVDSSTMYGLPRRFAPRSDGDFYEGELVSKKHVIESTAKQFSNGVDSSTPHGLPRRFAPRSDGGFGRE